MHDELRRYVESSLQMQQQTAMVQQQTMMAQQQTMLSMQQNMNMMQQGMLAYQNQQNQFNREYDECNWAIFRSLESVKNDIKLTFWWLHSSMHKGMSVSAVSI